MHYPCPNCGVAGNNFACTNHIINVSPPPWVPIQNPLIDEEKRWLFAETGRLFFENKRLSEENQSLKETLSNLEQIGVTDQFGRKLPLPDHHKDCPNGKSGWAKCTCEELNAQDTKLKQAEDGWKVCMQDSYGNRQYECLKCHYVTKWVKDHSDLAAAKQHACPSPIDRAFDDLMDDDEDDAGPKKCLHGNLECKRCNPARAIKTPEGKPLLPTDEFSRIRIEDNKERGLSECNFQRQTGRTTAMVIEALEFVNGGRAGRVIIEAHDNRMKKLIREWLKHYADELGVSHGDLGRIIVREPGEYSPGGALTLRDNAFDDTRSAE